MSDMPPLPGPTKEHLMLKELEGVWNVECHYFMEPGQDPMQTKATDTAQMVGDYWLQSRFESEMFGQPFTGVATMGFNPKTQQFESTWVDTMTPFLFHFTGSYDDSGKVLTMTGPGPHPVTGETCDYRTVETVISPDERHFEMFVNTPQGEIPMFTYIYRRA